MNFQSPWITTQEFLHLAPIDVFHKEMDNDNYIPSAEGPKNNHTLFRKTFYSRPGCSYTIRISADDYYKLYVNGNFIGQGPAPAYNDVYRYNEYDLTQFITAGRNVIGVHVYYQGYINRVWNSADNRQGMVADVYCDGNYIFGSDNTWKTMPAREYISGGTIGLETLVLENIDFRLQEKRWCDPLWDDGALSCAMEAPADDHVFLDAPTPPVEVYTVKPKEVVQVDEQTWFLDFGKEIVGQFFVSARGTSGQIVEVFCGEEISAPRETRYEMRCNCTYHEICTLSGRLDDFNFYDYKAFRYVTVKAPAGTLLTDSFSAVVRHHSFRQQCSLETSDDTLLRIWEMCVHTLKMGTQEGFLDCPSREKGQYLGDFTVSGLAYLYLTGDSGIYKKALEDFAESCRICPGMLAVAPGAFMQEIADFSLQYPLQLLHYVRYTKDKETLRRLLPVAEGILKHFSSFEREDGLLAAVTDKWNIVDWPPNLRDNYDFSCEKPLKDSTCHNVINAYYIGAIQAVNMLRDLLSLPPYADTEPKISGFLRVFYDADAGLFRDTERSEHHALHSNVLPVYFGFAPKSSLHYIHSLIREKGLCCGVQFSYFALKAIAKLGDYKLLYQTLVNQGEHSWYQMLREGATTCFEAWGKEQKWNTSLCHPWACAPVISVIEDLAGIDFSASSGKRLSVCSHIPQNIHFSLKITYQGESHIITN